MTASEPRDAPRPNVEQAGRLAAWLETSPYIGYSCLDCPLGTMVEPMEEVWNDPSEAHYDCEVLDKVWGEYAPCETFREGWFRSALITATTPEARDV